MTVQGVEKRLRLSRPITVSALPEKRFFIYSKFIPGGDQVDGLVVVDVSTLKSTHYPMAFTCHPLKE